MTQLFRRCDNDELVELDLSFDELMERQCGGFITLDDGTDARRVIHEELARDRYERAPKRKVGCSAYSRPLESVASGCPPHQVQEFREIALKHGLTGVTIRDDGIAEFSCRGDQGRRGWLKARGMMDFDGGYGDG